MIHTKTDDSKSMFGGNDTSWDSALETGPTELKMSHAIGEIQQAKHSYMREEFSGKIQSST
jgi:hypothetical protein